MKKLLVYGLITLMMLCPAALVTGCGGDTSSEDPTTEATEETITAADPQTPEEQEADDSDGCLEDSDDLLY